MALLYRKMVRDRFLAMLAADFNSIMAATATAYGVSTFTLDFSPSSINFAVSHITPENIDICRIQWSPEVTLGACLYTTDVVNKADPKQWNVTARMFANLDFYVRDRSGVESSDTEDSFDAIEDAAVQIAQNLDNQWPGGVIYTRDFEATREGLIPLGDGFYTRIPLKFLFQVYVQ